MNIKRLPYRLKSLAIRQLVYVSSPLYMRLYTDHLRHGGMNILGMPNYIGPHVYFDGSDYGLITLGDNVTISREVMLLTHDASLYTVSRGLVGFEDGCRSIDGSGPLIRLGPISIGDNTFIGARASVLPHTSIGSNVIVGAGAVVKGTVPDNVVVIGNPSRILGKTSELVARYVDSDSSDN